MKSNRDHHSLLEQLLPSEITSFGVAAYLTGKDITNASAASKCMNALFAPASSAAKLLHFVREADYEKAKEMIDANPLLMFMHTAYKNDNDSYESISPLKLAFKNLDTYMWKMFLEKIIGCKVVHILKDFPTDLKKYKKKHILVSGNLYAVNANGEAKLIQNSPLLNQFVKQLEEQKEHINLAPLFEGYKIYDDQQQRWFVDALNAAWLELGKVQRNLLLPHLLKEICRKGHSWTSKSKFDVNTDERPNDTEVYNFNTCKTQSILPLVPNAGLGYEFTIIRGGSVAWIEAVVCSNPRGSGSGLRIPEDVENLHRLCDVRMEDLNTLRSQFNLPPLNTVKMQSP